MPRAYIKSHFIRNIAKTNSLSREKLTETINTLLEIIERTLELGGDVLISGFGKFCVKDKKERRGRNPASRGNSVSKAGKIWIDYHQTHSKKKHS